MSTKFIYIGIIGYGKIGKLRHKILNQNENVKVISIYDPLFINNKKKIFKKNVNEILNNKQISTIFICTPNYLNYKFTTEGINKNKNIFCEKPPCLSEKELLKIIKLEKKHKIKLMYGFNHRHHESIKQMKELVISKKLGKILWMRGRYGKSVNKDFYKNWRSNKNQSGGGILIDQGIHMLDLLLYFSGGFDIIKSIVTNSYWKLDIEDNVFAIFKNKSKNISASLHSTITQWRHLFSLEIFLEKGYLVLNGLKTSSNSYGKEELSIGFKRTTYPRAITINKKKINFKVDKSFHNETNLFIEKILKNKKIDKCNTSDALLLMKVLNKIYLNN